MTAHTDSRRRFTAAARAYLLSVPLLSVPLLSALLLLAALPLSAGCGGASGEPSEVKSDTAASSGTSDVPARYNLVLDGRHRGGRLTVTVNGFPVQENTGMIRYRDTRIRLNTALAGKGNVVELRSEPLMLRRGDRLQMGEHNFEGQVKRGSEPVAGTEITDAEVDSAYAEWKGRAEREWERLLEWERAYLKARPDSARSFTSRSGGALDSLRAWAERHPLVVSTTFDNERGPDFSEIFETAPRIAGTPADTARLKDYAMRLRRLLEEGEAEALYEEIQPSVDEEIGYASITADSHVSRRREIAYMRENWNWNTDFARTEVGLRKWSGGRVWELYVKPDRPFFHNKQTWTNVYVAELDGELKVVRLN